MGNELELLCPNCGKNPAQEEHECPYVEEINYNHDTCTCCTDCEHECCMEI